MGRNGFMGRTFFTIAHLKFFPEKFTLSKLSAMMYSKKRQLTTSSFLGDKLTVSPVQGTSEISIVKERNHIANAHLKINVR